MKDKIEQIKAELLAEFDRRVKELQLSRVDDEWPKENKMNGFKQFRRKAIAEMRPYIEGEILDSKISISEADKNNGSPKIGDMIARNPKNHDDQWLIAHDYFIDNFEEIKEI